LFSNLADNVVHPPVPRMREISKFYLSICGIIFQRDTESLATLGGCVTIGLASLSIPLSLNRFLNRRATIPWLGGSFKDHSGGVFLLFFFSFLLVLPLLTSLHL